MPAIAAVNGNASDSDEFDYSDEEGAVRVEGIYIPPAPIPYCELECKGPRLIITKITNSFFKSYANKIILGPFNKSFNAIIGPNGSGKSNVIDSMLFVFGYRANKIRSKKLSVLLHNSKKYTHVTSCTVAVHFTQIIDKTNDEFEVVPNSELVVSRTANKDNSSHYTVNGRRMQFKEVAQLLLKHGIDLKHNRFLILQGEVEQIAMMPAKGVGSETGMLEYLEDIIGTTRYKEPLEKLCEKVEEYTEARCEKLNRLKIVQDEVEILKEPMQDAVDFLKLENDIAIKKNTLYQYNIFAIKENSKEVVTKKEALDADMKSLLEKLNTIVSHKKEKESELATARQRYDVLEKRKESTKQAYQKANNQHEQLKLEMQMVNKNRHKAKDNLESAKKQLEEYQRQPEEMQQKIGDCEAAMEKIQPKIDELQEEKTHLLANMKDLTKELQAEKETLTEELAELMQVVRETKTAYSLAESELKLCTSGADNEKHKLEEMQKTHLEIKTRLEQIVSESAKLRDLVPVKERELDAAHHELPGIKQQEAQLSQKLCSTRSKVEESRAFMQASRSKGRVLDALMQQKRDGNCPGFYGRLGDLGAIDAKYDVAISTACGPLDNFVVDTVETGQWCIEFLKRNDIGRATIIALDKQQHLNELCNSEIETPENVHRLFDLIRIPDDRFRPAFYYALRDTLVADDLDQASRIAYGRQRYRVVTLKGELIETTGAMSGGGNKALRGRMGQSVQVDIDPQEIQSMEKEINLSENALRALRQKQSALEHEISIMTPELKQMRVAQQKFEIELHGLREREPGVNAQLKEQTAKLKRLSIDHGKVRHLQKELDEKKCSYEEAAGSAEVIQKKVDDITAEISAKSRGKLQAIDKKLKDLQKNLDKLKSEVTRLKMGIKNAERNAVKSSESIESLQGQIKDAETQLLEMKDKRVEIETDAAKLLEIIEELTGQIEGESADHEDLKSEVKELAKQENQCKSEKIELDQQIETLQGELNEVQAQVHQLRAKIAGLKLQDVPDEERQELKEYTLEELDAINLDQWRKELHGLEVKLKAMKPNLSAIEEYKKKMQIVIARSKDLDEVIQKWQQMRDHYDKLRARRKDEFLAGFKIIKSKLKEMYQMITIGGDADFELVDTYDPFSEGIQFRVRPPRKTWKLISNLSGGEKTLSSLALVFALHYYKPSPLYVMDEIDAALDFKNVSIIGNYIKERTQNAQFIIISLRSDMFELANYLIGIFKIDDCTNSLTIDPRAMSKDLGLEPALPPQPQIPIIAPNIDGEIPDSQPSQDLFASQESIPAGIPDHESHSQESISTGIPDHVESDSTGAFSQLSQVAVASSSQESHDLFSDVESMEVDS